MLLSALLVSLATAGSLTVDPGAGLQPQHWYWRGVESPSVAHTGTRFVMAFASEVRAEGCDHPRAIGLAISVDGRSWKVRRRPLIAPEGYLGAARATATTPCGASDPSVVHDGQGWKVYFASAEGVGLLELGGGRRELHPNVLALPGAREPSVARAGDDWTMVVATEAGLRIARSDDGEDWDLDQATAIPNGVTSWSGLAAYSPALTCLDRASYPWYLLFAGEGEQGWGIGDAISDDPGAWFLGDLLLDQGPPWASFDLVRGEQGLAVWFETAGDDGRSTIGMASSDDWDGGAKGRACD